MTAGKTGDTPVGIFTLRLNPQDSFTSLNLMFDRPTLERLIEDVTYLLAKSSSLAEGEHQDKGLTLDEIEAIHHKLTD